MRLVCKFPFIGSTTKHRTTEVIERDERFIINLHASNEKLSSDVSRNESVKSVCQLCAATVSGKVVFELRFYTAVCVLGAGHLHICQAATFF